MENANASAQVLSKPERRNLLVSVGMSWLFDAMDVALISFVAAALAAQWSLGSQQIGVLTAINSVGMAVGAACAGILADRFGRKSVLLWTLLIFSLASGLSAVATGFVMLCILRFISGFGLGGELPVASTLVSESVPASERGRTVVLLESFWAGGWILAALIAYFIIPQFQSGWRIAFALGALPALYALYLRRKIDDSPRFVSQQQVKREKLTLGQRFSLVWAKEHRKTSIMLWILWFTVVFSYYGMFLWLPQVMVYKDYSLTKSFEYVLIMTLAQLPGYFTAAYFIEKFGRKFVLVVYLVLTAASAIWFGMADTTGALIAAGICLSFFNLGAWGGLYAYTPEHYPTKIRTTGAGLAASFGRIGGIIAPFLVGWLISQNVAISSIFTMFCITILVGAAAVAFLGKETKGTELEN
ncbi:MFS transporter [Saccharibacillus sp. CPCC 101409]|uniref:MFS transporter n=1 Tax=Saccharibacillus sp. CPCC 101409 TaxID=3058041 RepID=UPI002672B21B|nr:MFS transporter [Saccharibacillus sp. CPCC 101409]MDO3411724.1 MFS transporter [Saccharibacillus sp. CPCC 101409]